jgi:dihydropteridine reductase
MWRRTTARWLSNYTFKNRKSSGGGTAGKQSNNIRPPFVPETTASKKALVVGSSGTLGRAIVHELQEKHNMKVLQADVVAPPPLSSSRKSAVSFCDLSQSTSLADLTVHLATGVSQFLNLDRGETLDVVVCAAGGWAGNPSLQRSSSSPLETLGQEIATQAIIYAETIDRMRQVNLDPVLATSYLLQAQLLGRNGLLVVMGATAALQPTPDMIGYGIAKAATHYAVQTLAAQTTTSLEAKSVRDRSSYVHPVTILGLLPTILDTPTNRANMTFAPTWTPPHAIASEIGEWVETPALRPHSGALIKVFTNDKGATSFSIVR